MKALVTGGCGFIGHHLVEHIIKNTDWDVTVLDRLSYASHGFDRLRDIECFDNRRVRVFTHDIRRPINDGFEYELGQMDYILHLGAETHVDNSIRDPRPFVYSNVIGTMEILEFARRQEHLKWMVYFSTDEVFGPASVKYDLKPRYDLSYSGVYSEWDRYNSTNPYSATKAAGEELCLAYANTYKVPLFITHCMNAFGERQYPEKFIPLVMNKVMSGEPVMIHADQDKTRAGSRSWIHARNIAAAVCFLLDKAVEREKYNIAGEMEVDNLSMAHLIASELDADLQYDLVDFHSSRPGHDLRYALDGSKMATLGWKIPVSFHKSLNKTIQWYLANPKWLRWGMEPLG